MPRAHIACVLLVLAVAACGGTRARTTADAGPGDDAATDRFDAAGSGIDAAGSDIDAAATDVDAATVSIDAGMDAFSTVDATWGPCTYGGVMGTCESTSLCPAGSMPMMGLCPGPADIQCCLPLTDSGMPGTITTADVLARLGSCVRIGGNYANDAGGTEYIPVCQLANVIWWTADMDIDCDGGQGSICMSDPYYMASTSAVDSLGNPLDASTLPFIVIPLPSTRFRYADYGIRTGQVALVMYGNRMAFGIFGDAGPSSAIGEASFAMAQQLGIPSSPISGGVDSGVTYLVFTDATARVAHNESNAEAMSIGMPLLDALVHP